MILSIPEIIDMVIMIAIVGWIFSDIFRKPEKEDYDPLRQYKRRYINWDNFIFAALVTAPAILFHELAHKFVALSFGLNATFQAAYMFLLLGIIMKLMNFGFIFFVPAYVSISATASPLISAIISLAGPLTNLILWIVSLIFLKTMNLKRRQMQFLFLTSKINMFLFIFNILPIPGFDGYHFFEGIIRVFF